jgi:predicted acylesterase/phospholipase RssA
LPNGQPSQRKTHVVTERPPFECIALLLQGGGALGSYQAGVYQALTEADLHPDWVAGISIGAINSALIAGNAPEQRVDKLRGREPCPWRLPSLKPQLGDMTHENSRSPRKSLRHATQ